MLDYEAILSRDSYLLSVELRVFWAIAFAYGSSFILHIFHVISRSPLFGRWATRLLLLAAFAHSGLIIFRTFEAGRAPFQSLYESLSWFACSTALTCLYASRKWPEIRMPGLLVSALALGASLYALLARSPAADLLPPALRSYWFEWHVVLAFFSYAVFVVSASFEASYLAAKALLKRGSREVLGFRPSMLDEFRQSGYNLAAFGYPLLTFAIFSGAAWANDAWGRYWSWDPKETWSLITWTVFTIYLHSKAVPSLRGLPASVFNLVGFVCMMMTFLGVNWLAKLLDIPSLHVYAV